MGLISSLRVSSSALMAQRLRMDLVANNVANMNSSRGADGSVGPYRRQTVRFREQVQGSSFSNVLGRASGASTPAGVEVASIQRDTAAPRKVHDPTHPDADENGDVLMPNIDIVTEMTDLVGANRAYEASVTVLNATKSLAQAALQIGRR